MRTVSPLPIIAATLLLPVTTTLGATRQEATVAAASAVLDEIMAIPVRRIPAAMLADAQAIAIVPNVIKGSIVIGARRGKGVVVIRDPLGHWQAPAFVTLTGGSVGWQIGVQSTDVILVFKTRRGVEGLMRGKFTIGADAAAAAGPVGRQAAAATDGRLAAEIYSYSRSRGLFAGVSLDGSVLKIDHDANAAFYHRLGKVEGDEAIPACALTLLERVVHYTTPVVDKLDVVEPLEIIPIPGAEPVGSDSGITAGEIRRALAEAAGELAADLDDGWKRYLALPAEVYEEGTHPSPSAMRESAQRFDQIAADPQYRALTERPEFQNVHRLLKQYEQLVSQPNLSRPPLPLPAPPGGNR